MIQLVPTERADRASALEALMMYFSLYKVPRMIMTDGARHFVYIYIYIYIYMHNVLKCLSKKRIYIDM